MEQQPYKNRAAFSLIEMIAVLFVVSIMIIIISYFSINSYGKYQERLALNELISEIYYVQTQSINNEKDTSIEFYSGKAHYRVSNGSEVADKELKNGGKVITGGWAIDFRYRKGNLVSKANSIVVKFQKSSYKIIVHLDSGYVTVDEK